MCAMAHRSFTLRPHRATSLDTSSPRGDSFSACFLIKNVKIGAIIFAYPYTYRDSVISALLYFAKINHKS